MAKKLIRHYGRGHLHFITFTCFLGLPLRRSVRAKNGFVGLLRTPTGRMRTIGFVGDVGQLRIAESLNLFVLASRTAARPRADLNSALAPRHSQAVE
jgi:hypothetical protein